MKSLLQQAQDKAKEKLEQINKEKSVERKQEVVNRLRSMVNNLGENLYWWNRASFDFPCYQIRLDKNDHIPYFEIWTNTIGYSKVNVYVKFSRINLYEIVLDSKNISIEKQMREIEKYIVDRMSNDIISGKIKVK